MSPTRTHSMVVRHFRMPILVHIFPPVTFSKKTIFDHQGHLSFNTESNAQRTTAEEEAINNKLIRHLSMQHHKLHVG